MNINFKIGLSKNNLPIIEPFEINNETIAIQSAYSPDREAERIINNVDFSDKEIIIILGLGLGYYLAALSKKKLQNKKIIVIEKFAEIYNLFLQHKDKIFRQNNCDFEILINPNEHELMTVFSQYINFKNFFKIKIIENHNLMKLDINFYHFVLKSLQKYLEFTQSNLLTTSKFGEEWILNSFENLRYYKDNYNFPILKKYCADKPALIVSAGPSLEKNIQLLKKFKDNFFVFCVDTAANALISNNIIPDFICAIDSQIENYKLLENIENPNIYLITTLIVNPNIPKKFNTQFYFNTKQPVDSLLEKFGYSANFVKSGGSVATSLFSIVREIYCNPIIFIGQDLSFTNLYTHTKLSNKFLNIYKSLNKFTTFETLFFNENIGQIYETDIFGKRVFTSKSLLDFCRWFELEFTNPGYNCRYINASGAGILKNNIEIIDFEKVCSEICSKKISKHILLENEQKLISDNNFQNLIKKLNNDFAKLLNIENLLNKTNLQNLMNCCLSHFKNNYLKK